MLTVSGLSVSRGERVLFRDVSFELHAGHAIALTGANGAGKTSLLRAVAGFLEPDAGSIVFRDLDVQIGRSRHTHWMGHLDGLKAGQLAREELAFHTAWSGADRDGVLAAVDVLALGPLLDLEIRKLSAGQRRRLAFARLIAVPRPIWLLDEPLSPLDTQWRMALGLLMQAHLDKGGAILAAVHDPLPVKATDLPVEAMK